MKLPVTTNSESLFGITRVEICGMSTLFIHKIMSIELSMIQMLLTTHLINIEEAVKLPVLICSRNMLQNDCREKGVT